MPLHARVLTVSDSAATTPRADTSGPALVCLLTEAGFDCEPARIVPDGIESVAGALRAMSNDFTGLIVTTGGTGFAPTDLTPEATRSVLEREAPGLAEAARAAGRFGALSRGVAGTIGTTIVLNVPGSPSGATESLLAVIKPLEHALALLAGQDPHHAHRPQ